MGVAVGVGTGIAVGVGVAAGVKGVVGVAVGVGMGVAVEAGCEQPKATGRTKAMAMTIAITGLGAFRKMLRSRRSPSIEITPSRGCTHFRPLMGRF